MKVRVFVVLCFLFILTVSLSSMAEATDRGPVMTDPETQLQEQATVVGPCHREENSYGDYWWECYHGRVTQVADYSDGDFIIDFQYVGGYIYWKYYNVKGINWYEKAYYGNWVSGNSNSIRRLTQVADDDEGDWIGSFFAKANRVYWKYYNVKGINWYEEAHYSNAINGNYNTIKILTQIADKDQGDWINDFTVVGDMVFWKYYDVRGVQWSEYAYYANSIYGGTVKRVTQLASYFGGDIVNSFQVGLGGREYRVSWKYLRGYDQKRAHYYNCLHNITSPRSITPMLSSDVSSFSITGDEARWYYSGWHTKVLSSCGETAYFTFNPTDDTWVNQDSPNATYGSLQYLRVRPISSGHGHHTYLKFYVSNIPSGAMIQSATLKLRLKSKPISVLGAYRMTVNSWFESSLTWNNASIDGRLITMVYNLGAYQWTNINVTSFVQGNGTFTIGLGTNDNIEGLDFYSKESAYDPVLEVRYVTN